MKSSVNYVRLLSIVACVQVYLLPGFLFAQPYPDTLWTRTYGDGEAHSVIQASHGGYLMAGYQGSIDAYPRIYLVRTNSAGDTLWTRTYGGSSGEYAYAYSAQADSDGGYIVVGGIRTNGASYFYVLKIDDCGDTLWTRKYGITNNDRAYSVALTHDNGYIIAGEAYAGTWYSGIYIVRTNSAGDTLWTRMFWDVNMEKCAYSIQSTPDSGHIITGYSKMNGQSYRHVYLIKINSVGDAVWSRIYGNPYFPPYQYGNSVALCSDSGYIIAGTEYMGGGGNSQVLAIKTNSLGDTLWTRQYGGNGYWEYSHGYSVAPSSDEGYIIAGYTSSYNQQNYTTYNAVYLIQINSIGDTLWTRRFTGGGSNGNSGYSVKVTSDGGYIIAGSKSIGSNPYFYLIRMGGRAVHVISPNGGEQWQIFQTDTVRWDTFGYEGNVKIELNRHYPYGSWETLATNTPNDGEETFLVTDPLSDSCRISVSTIPDSLTDISDSNFSIVSSEGYLALVRTSQLQIPIISWNAGVVECPLTTSLTFHLKNFGNESVVVYLPILPIGPQFTLVGNCATFTLEPGQVSSWTPTITYNPLSDGSHHDTLRIMTDAVNQQGGYVRIPLTGQQISTPATPTVVINIQGNDAHLTWAPITESIFGCPVTVTAYLVFYSPSLGMPYYFHGLTTDTTYVHGYVVRYASGMFYDVIAVTDPLSRLDEMLAGGGRMTREEALEKLRITN